PVRRDTAESIAERLTGFGDGTKAMLGFAATTPNADEQADWAAELRSSGYVRLVAGGRIASLAGDQPPRLDAGAGAIVVVDRVAISAAREARLTESIEAALAAGGGRCVALVEAAGSSEPQKSDADEGSRETIDGRPWRRLAFSSELRCDACQQDFQPPEPQLFNFNSPLGACELCEGFGSVAENDMDLVVPDRSKSIRDGAIAPWNTPAYRHELDELLALAGDYGLPVDVPFAQLTPEHVKLIQHGVPEREFGGLDGFFRWLERRKYKMHIRVFLSRWRSYRPCPGCGGARLKPPALAVRVAGKNFAELCQLTTADAERLLATLDLQGEHAAVARRALGQAMTRLRYLVEVGLGYLTLDRSVRTLSTGESQRVAMTATLGSNLVDMLYVLDEPSVGLHPADVPALAAAIRRLRDRGNTVVVVEHEEAVIHAADQVVEFGPQAGAEGGRVVFQGPPDELIRSSGNRTSDWLAGRRVYGDGRRRPVTDDALRLLGAAGNNLKSIDVTVPLGVLCVVTGVSGAGKSSLVLETLYPALCDILARTKGRESPSTAAPLPHGDLLGAGTLDEVLLIDAQPISRSPRSNPVTYIKAFDPIRSLFAEQPEAKARGLTASHFSFNVEGGRCDACSGAGYLEIDMQFLADVNMKCRECDGRRYQRAVLDVTYRGRSIAEVLQMTAHEAFRFFRGQNRVQAKLKVLLDVGLDYLQLGQPANTLSGGEAQRLKLAGRLAGKPAGRTLFVLDEPTTGLHFSDVVQLIDCFNALADVGHSLLIVEHNVQVMMAADWVIDLGPGAGAAGGAVVATGTPEAVAEGAGPTASALRVAMQRDRHARALGDE
ncbi:MAG: excinuclease ABC subunit UvrA, partial [Planctomycetota bacterium]